MNAHLWPYGLILVLLICQCAHPLAGALWVFTLAALGLVDFRSSLLALACCLRCWWAYPAPPPPAPVDDLPMAVEVVARVVEPPRWRGAQGCSFVAEVEHWTDRIEGPKDRWLVECAMPPGEVALGERWLLEGQLKGFDAPAYPGDLDRRTWWFKRGVYRRLHCRQERFLRPPEGLLGWRYRLTQRFADRAPHPRANLLSAIVFGDGSRLERHTLEGFRRAGASHLLVASGANVALLVGWVLLVGKLLGLGPRRCSLCCMLVVPLYVLMAGGSPGLVRAGAMAWLALLARWTGRTVSVGRCLVLGALGVLLWDPGTLDDLSFQLSFAAVASLAWLVPALGRLPLGLGAAVGCWLGLLPWSVGVFHSFQPFSPLANLWLVPLVEGLLPMGGVLVLLDQLSPALGELALKALNPWLWLVERSVEFWASCPEWELWVPRWQGWLAWSGLILGCVHRRTWLLAAPLPLLLSPAQADPQLHIRWFWQGSAPVLWLQQGRAQVAWFVRPEQQGSLEHLRRSQAAAPFQLQLDLQQKGQRSWNWQGGHMQQAPGRLSYRVDRLQVVLTHNRCQASGASLQLLSNGQWSWQGARARQLEPGQPWHLQQRGQAILLEPWIIHEPLRTAVFYRLGGPSGEL